MGFLPNAAGHTSSEDQFEDQTDLSLPALASLESIEGPAMHLMYYLDEQGKRVYTLKKAKPDGDATKSARRPPLAFCPLVLLYFECLTHSRVTLEQVTILGNL